MTGLLNREPCLKKKITVHFFCMILVAYLGMTLMWDISSGSSFTFLQIRFWVKNDVSQPPPTLRNLRKKNNGWCTSCRSTRLLSNKEAGPLLPRFKTLTTGPGLLQARRTSYGQPATVLVRRSNCLTAPQATAPSPPPAAPHVVCPLVVNGGRDRSMTVDVLSLASRRNASNASYHADPAW